MADKPTSPPPAYFLSLSLENVRSFGEKQTISFAREDGRPAQWTIILGDNGVGKTTVLKSLAGLSTKKLSNQNYWFPAIASELAEKWNPIRFAGQKTGELLAKIELGCHLQDTVDENQLSYYNSFIDLPGEDSPNQPYGMGWARLNVESEGLMCYGYGAGRTVGNSTISEAQEAGELYSSLFDDRANLLNPEEWFLRREFSSLKGDKGAANTLEQVKRVLLRVLPDVTDLKTTSENHEQYLELQTPYGWVRLRDMSLGYQTLVVWLTDFASKLFIRYPDSKNPLKEPAIVLIDEIDLHLHPSWQRKLIGFLSEIFINTQFIATAHSPLVVQAAADADANVVLLKREGDQTIVHQNTEDVRGWRLDQILTSELFGLKTARSPVTERKLERRAELLTKTKRTAVEKQELADLTKELDAEPAGETPSEREVDAVLQELRQRLLKNQDARPSAA